MKSRYTLTVLASGQLAAATKPEQIAVFLIRLTGQKQSDFLLPSDLSVMGGFEAAATHKALSALGRMTKKLESPVFCCFFAR